MTDIMTPARRSEIMSRVRAKNTKPEIAVRRAAHALGLRFRLHRRDLPGTPDLVFPRLRVALFVHGCFWHRHEGCAKASTPSSRVEFWAEKLSGNVARDARKQAALLEAGWRPVIIWECETRKPDELREIIRRRLSIPSAEVVAKPG